MAHDAKFMMIMVKMIPEEIIIERLIEVAAEFKLVPSDENRDALIGAAIALTTKKMTEKDSLEDIMEQMNRVEAFTSLENSLKNPKQS